MVLDLEINGITQTERCIRSQNNDGPRFRRNTGLHTSISFYLGKQNVGNVSGVTQR